MAETMQSLDQLSSLKPAAPDAPKHEKKVDKFNRAYATGKRKDAVARVWIKPGSGRFTINERTARSIFEGKFPERIVEKAVERMLPRGPLARVQLGNLRVYPGAEHPHAAQQPVALDVGAMNRKNKGSA